SGSRCSRAGARRRSVARARGAPGARPPWPRPSPAVPAALRASRLAPRVRRAEAVGGRGRRRGRRILHGAGLRAARRAGGHDRGRRLDRLVDLRVARAPAEVAGKRLADLLARRLRVVEQERVGGHEDPGRAEPALCGAVIAERGLERVRRPGPGPGETLDGRDAPALGLPDRGDAGEDGLVIEEDGAGAAVALVAPLLRAGQAE